MPKSTSEGPPPHITCNAGFTCIIVIYCGGELRAPGSKELYNLLGNLAGTYKAHFSSMVLVSTPIWLFHLSLLNLELT